MILGDLDLDWAEQDPDYLARVKAFLLSSGTSPEPAQTAGPVIHPPVSVPRDLGLK